MQGLWSPLCSSVIQYARPVTLQRSGQAAGLFFSLSHPYLFLMAKLSPIRRPPNAYFPPILKTERIMSFCL